MNNSIDAIIELLQQNQFEQALTACTDLLSASPHSSEVHHLHGLICAKMGYLSKAIQAFNTAIQLDPLQAIYHNNMSNAYKAVGKIDLATQHLYEALRLSPNYAEGHNNLGSLYYTQGLYQKAIPHFEKAIRLHPQHWEAHYNLANCFIKQDSVLEAISHYQTVLKLRPSHPLSVQNLAMAYVTLKDFESALPLLEETANNNPMHSELQAHLAEAYLDLGKPEQAITQFEKALKITDDRPEWHHNIAVLYLRQNNKDKALNHFQATLKYQPENDTARHMVLALTGQTPEHSDTSQYVSELFDQYAVYYDKHVKEQLQYQVPGLLRQTLAKLITPHSGTLSVLDIGCGTGQCGIYFRDIAKFLVGVDISGVMLAHAKQLGAYDALCQYNIEQGLPGLEQNYFDLAIAADVFVYLGNLSTLFASCTKTLKPEGKLCFTVEMPESETDEFTLQTTGRYAHSEVYIRQLAKQHGFEILVNDNITLREHEGRPIKGQLYVLTLAKTSILS